MVSIGILPNTVNNAKREVPTKEELKRRLEVIEKKLVERGLDASSLKCLYDYFEGGDDEQRRL